MAEALDREKLAIQRLAAQFLGVPTRDARITTADLATRDQLGTILAQPVDASEWEPLQDPLTGAEYFIWGLSDFFADSSPLIPA